MTDKPTISFEFFPPQSVEGLQKLMTARAALSLLSGAGPISQPSKHSIPESGDRLGPWRLGEATFDDANWNVRAATHWQTGLAVRVTQMKPTHIRAQTPERVLESVVQVSRMDHPGILAVLDWGRLENGLIWVVTSSKGQNLLNWLAAQGPLSEPMALKFMLTLCDALAVVHQAGYVYQMVLPGSVWLSSDGRDVTLGWPYFLVAEGTPSVDRRGEGIRAWVHPYFVPEAADKKAPISASADIYGLGEILFFLLTGRSAFQGEQMPVLLKKMEPPNLKALVPEITAPTSDLISSCLAFKPSDRPSLQAVRKTLERILSRFR